MELTAAEAWTRILESARPHVSDKSFRMWLAHTEPLALSQDQLTVKAPSDFAAEWIADKYGELLSQLAGQVIGSPIDVQVRVGPGGATRPATADSGDTVTTPAQAAPPTRRVEPAPGAASPRPAGGVVFGNPLNERYTFERFVVGTHNQLAAAASRAVAESPARMYNPLFIYGGVGLGKTHLMHAIGHVMLARDAGKRVAYISSERFTNDLIASIQEGRMAEFRRRYRDIDLLLIDDVQFLAEKERTQEEFFHTFNALYEAQRQIVLTSDRPPKEISGLEERLVSRFEWGLVTDIKPPDLETRVAILRKKAEEDQLVLATEVLDYIARNCRSNVRELEGAVIKLLAYSSLTRRDTTVELAREALGGVLAPLPTEATPESIQRVVAEAFGVTIDGMTSKRRTKELTVPRQVAMYLVRTLLDLSLVEIGRLFGGRDHSTVIHSITRVDEGMKHDAVFRARVLELQERLSVPRN
jgi:chromosomal replication initiator protein